MAGVPFDVKEFVSFGIGNLPSTNAAKWADRDVLGGVSCLQRRSGARGTRSEGSASRQRTGSKAGALQEIAT